MSAEPPADLPLRVKYLLFMGKAVPRAFLCFVLLGLILGNTAIVIFAPLYLVISLWAMTLGKQDAREIARSTDDWRTVEMREDQEGFSVHWEPREWRDLSPSRNPTLWSECVQLPLIAAPLALILGLADWLLEEPPVVLLQSTVVLASVLGMWFFISFFVIPVTVRERSHASLTSRVVTYSPARVSWVWGQVPLRLGGTRFKPETTRAVNFAEDAVTVLVPPLYGLLPRRFRVPATETDIRRAMLDWAVEHRIPTTGQP